MGGKAFITTLPGAAPPDNSLTRPRTKTLNYLAQLCIHTCMNSHTERQLCSLPPFISAMLPDVNSTTHYTTYISIMSSIEPDMSVCLFVVGELALKP